MHYLHIWQCLIQTFFIVSLCRRKVLQSVLYYLEHRTVMRKATSSIGFSYEFSQIHCRRLNWRGCRCFLWIITCRARLCSLLGHSEITRQLWYCIHCKMKTAAVRFPNSNKMNTIKVCRMQTQFSLVLPMLKTGINLA